MNLEEIIARMNAIVDEVRSSNDVEKVKKLSEEYDNLDAQKQVLERAQGLKKVDTRTLKVPGASVKTDNTDPYATLEYRTAFKAFVQKGTPIPTEFRAGGDTGTTVAADVGAIIPTTILNEFIKETSKVYGQVYSKVRKMNIRGGVKIPKSKLKATFKWITETSPSSKQKAGDIKEFLEFSYNMGEIRIATTLLANVVALDIFETEVVKLLTEAFLEAMDTGIINGTGSGQLLGITKDVSITQTVTLTATEIDDWTSWRKKLFAKLPLSKRGKGEFLFPASTVESHILTLKDSAGRPVYKEATEAEFGVLDGKFFGRPVTLVEPDLIKDFDTAAANDVIGIYGIFADYAINTNMQFTIKRYFDEDTNEYIDKALVIIDGKPVDPSSFWLIKKADA